MQRVSVAVCLLLAACQSGAALGTACTRNSDCSSPLACSFGRCRSECSAQRDCPIGAMCLLDQNGVGSCSLRDDPDCTIPGCAAPLACIGRACVNVCSVGPECPPGSACVPVDGTRARCVRTDGQDAGLLEDDAATDAARESNDAGTDAAQSAGHDGGRVAPHDADVDASGACSPRPHGTRPCDTAIHVVVDDEHSCVNTEAGHVWCWGENVSVGRDGDDLLCSGPACPTPALVRAGDAGADADDVESIRLSGEGGCYTTHTTGLMFCWGTHEDAAPLGTGMMDGPAAHEVRVHGAPISNTGTFIVFGASAISNDVNSNEWYGWGTNAGNVLQLGVGTQSLDVATDLGPGWANPRYVAAGRTHACGIDADGGVSCWGSNAHGESSYAGADPAPPTMIAGLSNVSDIAAGNTHTCALVSGQLLCWGDLSQVGGATTCTSSQCPPTRIDTGTVVVVDLWPVSDSDDLCVTDVLHHLYCWGPGASSFGANVPTLVPGFDVGEAWITASHGCAIDTNSVLWCWGHNELGQLGLGYVSDEGALVRAAPVVFP